MKIRQAIKVVSKHMVGKLDYRKSTLTVAILVLMQYYHRIGAIK